MSIGPGARLGPYEIQAAIGSGGMGEVYRATDTNLKRAVAIKVLPESVATDRDRLARFQREAEVLASLNHPNVAAIYGLERSDGVTALVMELVEGRTLADRIAQGPISVEEALPIAKQIAEALEAAHEQGIIHRDLKPANIKVRPDGAVKVLDFGLAKALEPASNTQLDATASPTITSPAMMTGVGMLLGTAAYMSPEQARGKAVDKRSDIWAFGCLLYEMLAGRRAFVGDTVSDTLASVLKSDPNWTALPLIPTAPLWRLLRRCLEKDRSRRLASAADARLEIEEALTAPAMEQALRPSSRAAGFAWTVAVVAALIAAGLAVPALRYLREAPPAASPETRTEITTPATNDPLSIALSPDGRSIAFVASGDGASRLWLRSLAGSDAQPLVGTEGAVYPFWSPDSRSVAFFASGQLKRLDIGGGAPQTLTRSSTGPRGGTWSAEGVILFSRGPVSPLNRIAASGGAAVPVTRLSEGHGSHRFPKFLPDGRHFIFYAQGAADVAGIYLSSLDSIDATRLTLADAGGGYLPPGWLLWVRAGTLIAQRLDLERRALTGNALTLATGVRWDGTLNTAAVSVSASGLVAYRPGGIGRRQLTWFNRAGDALGTLGPPDHSALSGPSLSPDSRRVVVARTVQGNQDLWLLDGTRMSRFTFDSAVDRVPVWSPDGTRIAFDSNRKGVRNLYEKLANSEAPETVLVESADDKVPLDYSPDGRFVLYVSVNRTASDTDLWVRPMDGVAPPWIYLRTPFAESWSRFSPDGRWVAYTSNESGRPEVYIRPFSRPARSGAEISPAGGPSQVSTDGGMAPMWRADGGEVYYIAPTGEMMAAPITTRGTTLELGTPVALFRTRIFGGGVDTGIGRQYDVTRDGRFLINTVLDDAPAPITLIQNWAPPESRP